MLADMKDLVTLETDVPWFPAFQHSLDNIYYWASRMLPIYSARLFNDTPAYNRKFPPLDFLFIPGGPQAYSKEWHNVTRDVCVGREGVRVEYGSGTWAAAWRSSPRQWKCFKRAVILGTNSMAVRTAALSGCGSRCVLKDEVVGRLRTQRRRGGFVRMFTPSWACGCHPSP
jgi:hypothetical protein